MVLKSKESSRSNFSIVGSQRTRNTGTSFSESYDVTNFDTTKSYDLRLEVTDGFFTVSSQVSVSTGKVLFSLKKDIGIGVGKYHQNGVLDIEGNVHLSGQLNMGGSIIESDYGGSLNLKASGSRNVYVKGTRVYLQGIPMHMNTSGSSNPIVHMDSSSGNYYAKFYKYLPSVVVSAKVKGTTGIAKYGDVNTKEVQGIEIIRANGAGNSNVDVAVSAIAIGQWQ